MADALWQWDDLVRAAGGVADDAPAEAITGFALDTRALKAGEVFVALVDQRDGHAFVPAAFKSGAPAALVASGYQRQPGDGALIRVDDTLRGLERIGAAARARLAAEARVIAVTGSAGKTGTKEMLRACLSRLGPTHAPEKSFNNHWGVPLTLARMPASTRYGVFEIGMNHAGEITPLTKLVRPHVAIVTNVLPVHVGNFPDGEIGVAKAKAEIFCGLTPGGTAVILADSPHADLLRAAADAAGARVVAFGRDETSDVRLTSLEIGAGAQQETTRIAARIGSSGREFDFVLGMVGRHLATNALAVVAALEALGCQLALALPGLAAVHAPVGRGERHLLAAGDGVVLLIDESYNANPASMGAALATLAQVSDGRVTRKLAVMGDMLELGDGAGDYHKGLQPQAERADLVFACGPNMKLLYDSLSPVRRGHWTPTASELSGYVLAALRPGDVVMVKGSLGSRMAPIVAAIKARFASAA